MNELMLVETTHTVSLNFTCLSDEFIQSLDVSDRSRETYHAALNVFLAFLSTQAISVPTRQDILAYKGILVQRGLSAFTVSTYLVAVRQLFSWLEAEKVCPNIAATIKGLKRPQTHSKEILNTWQIHKLLGFDRADISGLRDYAIINLMLRTGLRTIEVVRADVTDIGTEGAEIVLRIQGKGRDSKDAFVVLTDEAYQPIYDYLQARGVNEGPIFLSHSDRTHGQRLSTRGLRDIICRRMQAAGVKTDKVSAHSLRHTTATLALMNGADVVGVRDMLRHQDLNTTMIYVRNLKRISNAAELYVKF